MWTNLVHVFFAGDSSAGKLTCSWPTVIVVTGTSIACEPPDASSIWALSSVEKLRVLFDDSWEDEKMGL